MIPQLPTGLDDIISPALLVFSEALDSNLDRMVAIAGGRERLRPHVKTHKMPDVVRRLMDRGVDKAKCATLTEARMLVDCGVRDILVAMPAVGPNAVAIANLAAQFPDVRFSTLADHPDTVGHLADAVRRIPGSQPLRVLLDLDVGMHRTGLEPGAPAVALAQRIAQSPGLSFAGLHVYDGHLRDPDPAARDGAVKTAFAPVDALQERLAAVGLQVSNIVAGGTPSFPVHATRSEVECSPGTTTLWDVSSQTHFGDMGFVHAAALLTRVISLPGGNRVCVDLGHKAVAAEMPPPRVFFPRLGPVEFLGHSEEHLVFATDQAAGLRPGDPLLALPWHICPTVALYDEAVLIRAGSAQTTWEIAARRRPKIRVGILGG